MELNPLDEAIVLPSRQRAREMKRCEKFEANNQHRIENYRVWEDAPFYRKKWFLALLVLQLFGPLFIAIPAFLFIARIWATGEAYYLKSFGMDELVVRYKRSTLPLICVIIVLCYVFVFFNR